MLTLPRNLTYCTNIHPGEAWADVLRNLDEHALAVKRACSPHDSFPLGLRLSARAVRELDPAAVHAFRHWCERHGCHVLTVNGFPYGQFHGAAVKANVYAPDWRTSARADYTMRLADVLAQWTPASGTTSISTVPVAFRPGFLEAHWPLVRSNLVTTLTHLARLHERGGPLIVLALEPEPQCVLERSSDVLAFFERMALPQSLAPHLGICLDCCHQAVEFEDAADCLDRFARAGIVLAKVQLSSALRARGAAIADLLAFDEPTYLHQAVLRCADGRWLRFEDLPQLARWLATASGYLPERDDECRVHFHVPVFLERLAGVDTTQGFLRNLLARIDPQLPLEVETYSFDALPPALRLGSVAASIVRELDWVKEALHAPHGRH